MRSAMLLAAKSLVEITKGLPPEKARELRALWVAVAALLILAAALVGIAWWTVRRLRRRLKSRLGSSRPVQDAWYRKPTPDELSSEEDEPRS
jgi:hypothetical protein